MRNIRGNCRLCGQEQSLCRSHIVSEFAYRPIKNEKNQIFAIGNKVEKIQKGYVEHLLCQKCELHISKLERRFANLWMDPVRDLCARRANALSEEVINVPFPDFNAFKLFHLSVLWRAMVARNFSYGPMTLGPYESKIVSMIRNDDAGQPGDFPVFGFLKINKDGSPDPTVTMLSEAKGRWDHSRVYMMSYAFCEWMFVIAKPAAQWMIDYEAGQRDEQKIWLSPVSLSESRSFKLALDLTRSRLNRRR